LSLRGRWLSVFIGQTGGHLLEAAAFSSFSVILGKQFSPLFREAEEK
jgi:hypothetical protein